jgi:hypothetical protein
MRDYQPIPHECVNMLGYDISRGHMSKPSVLANRTRISSLDYRSSTEQAGARFEHGEITEA